MESPELKKFAEEVVDAVKYARGEKIEIAVKIYRLILEQEDKGAAFQYFLEVVDDIEMMKDGDGFREGEKEEYFTKSKIERLTRECTELIKGILNRFIGQNLEPKVFYQELWKKGIEDNPVLSKEEEKIYALYRIWMDGRIPYFKLEEGLTMENQKFLRIMNEKETDIKKMIFILNSNFSQRTEQSSQFIKILDSCKTEEEKAVMMAQILSLAEQFGRFQERSKSA